MTDKYTIYLNDLHGEYTGVFNDNPCAKVVWDHYAEENARGDEEALAEFHRRNRGRRETGGQGAGWGIYEDDPPATIWRLRGTGNELRALYLKLLGDLAAPAWHWYGMGGDDHCYDYWPNSMIMAAEFRDLLLGIGEAEAAAGDMLAAPYHTTYLVEDLRRVYWLCRDRYVADADKEARRPLPMMKGTPAQAEADSYFETEILSHDMFGER